MSIFGPKSVGMIKPSDRGAQIRRFGIIDITPLDTRRHLAAG
jgi:hypothetical protein